MAFNQTSSTCVNGYGTSSEYSQSTTGNITGVFDMAGGAPESVMGYTDQETGGGGSVVTFKNNKMKKMVCKKYQTM